MFTAQLLTEATQPMFALLTDNLSGVLEWNSSMGERFLKRVFVGKNSITNFAKDLLFGVMNT